MQADNNINNLFEGFEYEFGKGDWNAIESTVLANNKKVKSNRSKFKIGLSFGLVACVVLGVVHFSTSTNVEDENYELAENMISPVDQKEENIAVLPIEKDNIEKEDQIQEVNETVEPASIDLSISENFEKPKSKVEEVALVAPINETVTSQLPKFVIQRTNYCIGEKIAFISNSKTLMVKWNKKEMTIEEFKQSRLSTAGKSQLEILENGKTIQKVMIDCQAPMARIGYKKNYDIENPYVNFKALNASKSADYKWYVDGEPMASNSAFEHTFASKGMYSIKMVVKSSAGCKDSSIKSVRILRGYNLMATTIFNPKDGNWLPLGLKKEGVNYKLRIIDQKGETVFTSNNPSQTWNGSLNGNKQVSNGDLFYWVAQVTDQNGKISEYGNSLLINSELK